MNIEKITVGPAVLEVATDGSGDTILLLPFAGGDITHFDRFTPMIAEAGFRTVAVNPRGVSESTGPLEDLTLHDLAADVGGLIEVLGNGPAHVLGTSFGTRVARCLAADRPDLVRSLVLVSPVGLEGVSDPESAAAARTVFRTDISDIERQDAAAVAFLSPESDTDLVQHLRIWHTAHDAHIAGSRATPPEEWWTAGQAQILVVQGLDDRAGIANGHELQDRLGERVRLVEVASAGHFCFLERPLEVAEAVTSFLHEH
jgi:pimeloyl-ACP methyl ester carboxylesterase